MKFRVLAGQLMHETNTFSVQPADIPAFEKMFCFRGAEEIVREMTGTNSETAGFIAAAEAHDWELIHTVAAFANPCGKVTDDAFEELGGLILDRLEANRDVDGVLLALHGAMVTESYEDAETELLKRVRAIIGNDIPVAVTFDLHANVGPDVADLANIVCSYKTYPHIDMAERGRQAGDLLQRAMAGEIRPRTFLARRPLFEGADGGRTDAGPMIDLQAKARGFEAEAGVLNTSINAGFHHSDIFDVGPTVLVTGDGDDPRYQAMAEALMDDIWQRRDEVTNTYLTSGQAADIARQHNYNGKPLVIADYADNPGAGAYGDATNLLKAMLDARLQDACFGAVRDGEAAAALVQAGPGATVTLDVGGKVDPRFGGPPLELTGSVVHTGDGTYICDGPMWAGMTKHFGPSAVLRVGGIDVLVVTNLIQITDMQQFLTNGIDPREKRTVALKSMQHFRAAYEPIADKVIVCDSGALASPDSSRLTFKNIRRPLYPFDAIEV